MDRTLAASGGGAEAATVPLQSTTAPSDRPVFAEADGNLVSAVNAGPTHCSGTNLWKGFTMEVLETPASETPPRTVLVRHMICVIDSDEPLHFHWRQNNRDYKKLVSRGDHLIRSQQELQNFRWDRSARALILGIDPATMFQIVQEDLPEEGVQLQEFYGTPDDYLYRLLRALAADLMAGSPTGRTLGESLCTSIAAHSLGKYGVSAPRSRHLKNGLSNRRIQMILDYIDSRLAGPLSLFELAEEVGISPFYLTRLFKTTMKMTVHQYVTEQRIIRAKHLLQRTNLDIASIGEALGFSHSSHFSQTFRNRMGMSPFAFRSQK